MTKVMVFGSFDVLHPGHEHFLREAKKLGDTLLILVARDATITKLKGKPYYSETERTSHLSSLGIADDIILGSEEDYYAPILRVKPDIIALGYDQSSFTDNLKEELKKRGLEVNIVRLQPHREHIYKSSLVKKKRGLL